MRIRKFLKVYIKKNHANWVPLFRKVNSSINSIPFTYGWKKNQWIKNSYTKFGNDQRQYIFYSIARFCVINRPIDGYYLEFGCHSANTMRMAWNTFKYLFDWSYVGFDSFEGLPEIEDIDRQEIWKKGKLLTSEEEFIKKVTRAGMPQENLLTIKGFYNDSLTYELQKKLLPKKAAVIYVDCDLYMSTVPVLEFIKPFLQIGTIIVFDDWNCFFGDKDKGERKAFEEFKDTNPSLKFEEFVHTNEAKTFIYIGDKN